jgi:adenylyltransferase/sulfurtransferase
VTDPRSTAPREWEISPQEVAKLLVEGRDFLFLDCRSPEEHEVARIAGTRLMPMQDLDLHLPELRKHAQRLIVVHCHSGQRSLSVTAVLREQGFANVKFMAGGIKRWSQEIDASVTPG